jgi:hypothetical protein
MGEADKDYRQRGTFHDFLTLMPSDKRSSQKLVATYVRLLRLPMESCRMK